MPAHLDRLDMRVDRATAMLEAMWKARGIENSSSAEEGEGSASTFPMSDSPSIDDVDSLDA